MTKNRRHDIVKPSKFKTSMCTFYIGEGGCPFGANCAFAHGEEELRVETKGIVEKPACEVDSVPPPMVEKTTPPPYSPTIEHRDTCEAAAKPPPTDTPALGDNTTIIATATGGTLKGRGAVAGSSPASSGSTRAFPGGRADEVSLRRHTLPSHQPHLPPPPPPPPPLSGHSPMMPTSYSMAGPSFPPPRTFGAGSDFNNFAYAGLSPTLPSMTYYIPAMGNHPFSAINNNHHAVNAAPLTPSPTSYATFSHPLPPPPPPPPTSSMGPSTESGVVAAGAVHSNRAKPHGRLSARHVVSSNTMAHSSGRHTPNASLPAAAEVASPPYVYGLMAAAGVPLNPSTSSGGTNGLFSPVFVPHPQQPRLIVVPRPSGLGEPVVPSAAVGYAPSVTARGAGSVRGTGISPPNRFTSDALGGCDTDRVQDSLSTSTAAVGDGSRVVRQSSTTQETSLGAPSSLVQPQPGGVTISSLGGSGKTVSDGLWGPADSAAHPLRPPLVTDSAVSSEGLRKDGGDAGYYNTLLSGLGIGASSYTAISLDRPALRQGVGFAEDDDTSGGVDFDWTGLVERWLQSSREEVSPVEGRTNGVGHTPYVTTEVAVGAGTTSGPSAGTSPAKSSAKASSEAVAAASSFRLHEAKSFMAALNSKPVLEDGVTTMKAEGSAGLPPTQRVASVPEEKQRTEALCHVVRAASRSSPRCRRRPVTTNQFKSSCAAAAEDSGSVLLYCAEKNTFVYIPSGAAGGAMPSTTAGKPCETQLHATVAPSPRESVEVAEDLTVRASEVSSSAAKLCVTGSSDDAQSLTCCPDLGVVVRFHAGQKRRSVLEEVSEDETEYCI